MATSETFWFRHDVGASNDRLMQRLMRRHGMEGVGVYWGIIEIMYQEEGHIQLGHIEDLAFTFHVDPQLVDLIVRESGLFVVEDDWFYSERVAREFEVKNEKSEQAREKANKRWNKEENAPAMPQQCQPNARTEQNNKEYNTPLDTKVSIPPTGGKRSKFQKPSVDEVAEYCSERKNSVDPEQFIAFYDSNGWKVGKNPMKDWKAAVRTWEKRQVNDRSSPPGKPSQRTLGNKDRWDEFYAKEDAKHAANT